MRIYVNGRTSSSDAASVFGLRDSSFPDRDLVVLNGHRIEGDAPLREGDSVFFGCTGGMPDESEMGSIMAARDPPGMHDALRDARVGIAGLGGLGSNIAAMLARTGVGHMVIADFDTVEPTNLNRQNYAVEHLGMYKTEATADVLSHISPYVGVTSVNVRIGPDNIIDVFGDCDVVCEAFDSAEAKAMLVNSLLVERPGIHVVSGSGMAGYGDSNLIRTESKIKNLHVCGDGTSDAGGGAGLMAPRVGICAGHMANAVVRILMGSMK